MPEQVTTVKSESEKMVPIDTSGNSVDVELKEEKNKEETLEENVSVEKLRLKRIRLLMSTRKRKSIPKRLKKELIS